MIATLALVLAAVALVALPSADAAVDDEFTADGLNYRVISEDAVSVTGAADSVSSLVIPKTVDYRGATYRVTAIADKAFMGTSVKTADLGSVYMIGMKAFAQCGSLTSVTAKAANSVGAYAFYDDSSLAVVDLGGKAKAAIGTCAFAKCTSIYQVSLPATIAKLGDKAFSATTFVGDDGKKIDKTAENLQGKIFFGTGKLAPVDLAVEGLAYKLVSDFEYEVCACAPGLVNAVVIDPFEVGDDLYDVVSIAPGVFKNNTTLVSASLGPVTKVGDYAFYGCKNLRNVDMPCVKEIGFKGFSNCPKLLSDSYYTYDKIIMKNVPTQNNNQGGGEPEIIKGDARGVAKSATRDTSSFEIEYVVVHVTVKTVSFGAESIQKVGAFAFYNCTNVTSIDLAPNAVVGSCAFYYSGLDTIH
jgi:hypothetical protein